MTDTSWREGLGTITPYLQVKDAHLLVDFIVKIFGARESPGRHNDEQGRLMHTEVKIKDSTLMIGDPGDLYPVTAAALYIYVDNVDETYRNALEAGAKSMFEPADKPYGDRNAGVTDPFGNIWYLSSPIA